MKNKFAIIFCLCLTSSIVVVGQKHKTYKYPYYYLIDFNYRIQKSISKSEPLVINNSREFIDAFGTIPPSEINLHQYVLIPIIKSVGGCSNPIISNIEMIQNSELKTIDCAITIEIAGSCRRLFHINKGILVRKPPTGYTINVEFLFIYNKTR